VKKGEIRPTFFAPIDMPADNSVLPDLETKLPSTSPSAYFKFPRIGETPAEPDRELDYKRANVSATAGITPISLYAPSEKEGMVLDYNLPQVSATAGIRSATEGFTPIDYTDLDYSRPQVAASSGTSSLPGLPQEHVDYEFDTKLASSHLGATSGITPLSLYSPESAEASTQGTNPKIGYRMTSADVSYTVPTATRYQSDTSTSGCGCAHFREKATALGGYNPHITSSYIPRAGISDPKVRIKGKKE